MYLGKNESVSSLHLSALGYDVSPRSLLEGSERDGCLGLFMNLRGHLLERDRYLDRRP